MARIVVIGDLMTDTVAHATLPLARGSDTPAKVTTHGGGSGANVAAWLGADGADVAFVGRRGADIAGRNRDMELMGYGVDARLVMDPERPTGTCVVMVTHKGERTMLSDPGANAALVARRPAARPVRARRAPARVRVHAAVRGVARPRPWPRSTSPAGSACRPRSTGRRPRRSSGSGAEPFFELIEQRACCCS